MPSTLMQNTADTCSRCGAALPRRAPEGLCPRCVLRTISSFTADVESTGYLPARPETLAVLGDYELIEPLGQGGMGVVYKARQRGLNRMVALKLLPFGEFTRDDFVKRLRAEAEAAARLQHPNIVAIHEVGEHDGQPFFSMDYIEGQTLAHAVRDGPMPARRVARLVRLLADAVQYAHERGVLHRDLKPANVLLDALDQPHITDFGLAKQFDSQEHGRPASAATTVTLSGQPLGSPNYMPPEQAEGHSQRIGPRSDIYSLGAILFHLLTGRPPFAGETITAVLQQVVSQEAISPRLLNASIPRDLETICLKCLEKEPSRRYATARELADELARFERDEPIHARPVSPGEKLWRGCRRRPALAGSIAAAGLFLIVGLLATAWQWRRAERHAENLAVTVTRLKLDQAEERLNGGETAEGLALLGALLRQDPTNRVAAQRIVSILTQRNLFRPLAGSAQLWHSRWTSGFAQHEHLLITTTNHGRTLLLWNTAAGWALQRTIEVGEPVRHTTFSRNGRLLLVATHEKSLRLYDITDGLLRAGPFPIDGFTDQLLLAPDASAAVVIAGADDALSSWRSIRGAVIQLSDGQRLHKAIQFHWAAFSSDGRQVVTVNGRSAQVRDAATWEPVGKPFTEPARINTAEFSPDSSRVVTAGADFNVWIWEVASGQRLFKLPHSVNVQNASFTPDGKRIFTRDIANNGRLWDAAAGKMLGEIFPHQKGHGSTSFSPDGHSLLSYSRSTIMLRSTETALPLAESLSPGDVPTRARFLPDGRRIVVTTMNGSVRIWDAAPTAFAPRIFPEQLEMLDGSLSPDGKKLAIVVKSNWGRLWDIGASRAIEPYLQNDMGSMRSVRWSSDSRRFVTAANDKAALIRDAKTGLPVGAPLRHEGPVTYAEFSRDGRWIATASEDRTARIWNTSGHQPVSPPLKHQKTVVRAKFSPDGAWLATASEDRTVRVWSAPEGVEVGVAITNELEFSDIAFSPNGTHLGTAGNASYAQLWNIRAQRESTPRLRHAGRVVAIRFSADGRRVVTASSDGTARVWDANTGQPIARPLRHREEVTLAEFSPSDRVVLTASIDGTARLWDAATGHALSDSFRHDERIVAGEWARDGRGFLTVSYDRRAKLWPVFLVPDGTAPAWLPDLAEASGLLGVEGDQIFRPMPTEPIASAFDRWKAVEGNDAWGQWLQAFLAPREPRPIPSLPALP